MFDIEKELKTLGAKKHHPDETLRQRTIENLGKVSQKAVPRRSAALRWAIVSATAAVLAAVLLVTILPGTQQTSYFTIDINPSIGIETDPNGIILSIKAQNSDAEALLANLDLTGMSFIDALRCVVQAAEQQGYLKDNGHVLVAHFGVTAPVTEEQIDAAISESTHKQVNVLLLQSDRSDYEDASQTHQSSGISLLMRNAQQLGMEDADIDDIIQTIKKNNNANHGNGSSHSGTPAPTAAGTPDPSDPDNGNPNDPEKTNNGSNGNHGNSENNGNNGNSSNNSNGNNSNNGNNGQPDKEDKPSDDSDE